MNFMMAVDEKECPTCGVVISEDKKYCSKKCFYSRKSAQIVDPIDEQLQDLGVVIDGNDARVFCETCGAPVYLGRCSRFTTHVPPKKPRSR